MSHGVMVRGMAPPERYSRGAERGLSAPPVRQATKIGPYAIPPRPPPEKFVIGAAHRA